MRPAIQIETAVWPLRRASVELPVISFMAEALQRPPEIASIASVSVLETAADKFVALRARRRRARRSRQAGSDAGASSARSALREHGRGHRLGARGDARGRRGLREPVSGLSGEPDARYAAAVEGLAAEPSYAERYSAFQRLMVYGSEVDFLTCIRALRELSQRLDNVA